MQEKRNWLRNASIAIIKNTHIAGERKEKIEQKIAKNVELLSKKLNEMKTKAAINVLKTTYQLNKLRYGKSRKNK
ncbi:MAG: hypothetical protein ABH803_00710 [Candidatus Micrarchaeota archaeon]